MAANRRAFGSVRVLPSGRVQARYIGPDGLRHQAPQTFDSRAAAQRWLSLCESDILRGTWVDTEGGAQLLETYAREWLRHRPELAARTVESYDLQLRRHILPVLGRKELRQITPQLVRAWRQGLIDQGVGASSVTKAYRVLRAVMNQAVDDQAILRNPCRIRGAGEERTPERQVLTLDQVNLLAEVIEPRYRLAVLLAVFASLRWGEIIGLQRDDFDLKAATLTVRRAVSEVGGSFALKEPKSQAGRRTVAFPRWLVDEIEAHLDEFCDPGRTAGLFALKSGSWPSRTNFSKAWRRALAKAEVPEGTHFHDLRHTGNHLAASTGASTRELMARMGHSSVRAALIYQHQTAERDRAIADAMEALNPRMSR